MAPKKELKSSDKGKTVDKKSKDSKGSSTSETGSQNQKGTTIDKDNKASKGNKCSEIIKKTIKENKASKSSEGSSESKVENKSMGSEQDSGSKSSKNIDKGIMHIDRDMKHQYLVDFGILPGSELYEDCMVTGLAGYD